MDTFGEFNLGRYQVMPPLSTFDRGALRDSIRELGVLDPITVDEDNNVLDGHNRLELANELGIEPDEIRTVVMRGLTEEEKLVVARTLNLARRQLDIRSKRRLWSQYVEAIQITLKGAPESSDREISKRFGVHNETVGSIRAKLEKADAIPLTLRPHTNIISATDGNRQTENGANHAEHRTTTRIRLVIEYACPSSDDRKRGALPAPQAQEWLDWWYQGDMATKAPRSAIEATMLAKEIAERIARELHERPLETMKLKEPTSVEELVGAGA